MGSVLWLSAMFTWSRINKVGHNETRVINGHDCTDFGLGSGDVFSRYI